MPYEAKAIANYFLEKAKADGTTLTPMQLQKLVYFAHGWYLALFGQPLIKEPIQAWSYGPVIPSLYQEFKRFGDGGIDELASDTQFVGMTFKIVHPTIDSIPDEEERDRVRQFLDRVWQVYSRYTAIQLSNMTHVDGSPWSNALNASGGARYTIIDNEMIRRYFEAQRGNARANA